MATPRRPAADEVFDVDAYMEAEATRKPFRFRLGGKVIDLPNAGFLTARQSERMMTDLEGVLTEVADATVAEALMDLPGIALQEISRRWMRHAGLQPGDPLASRI